MVVLLLVVLGCIAGFVFHFLAMDDLLPLAGKELALRNGRSYGELRMPCRPVCLIAELTGG